MITRVRAGLTTIATLAATCLAAPPAQASDWEVLREGRGAGRHVVMKIWQKLGPGVQTHAELSFNTEPGDRLDLLIDNTSHGPWHITSYRQTLNTPDFRVAHCTRVGMKFTDGSTSQVSYIEGHVYC